MDLDHNFPDEVLVAMNLNNRSKFDVYRINLKNGAVEFDTENPGNILDWTADAQFQIRAAKASTPDGGYDLLVTTAVDQPWELIRHWGPDDQGGAVSFSEDGKTLYIQGSDDANARAADCR